MVQATTSRRQTLAALQGQFADLMERAKIAELRQANEALGIMLGDIGYQERMIATGRGDRRSGALTEAVSAETGRYLTPEYFDREAGWGADLAYGMTADPSDRHRGANAPVFRTDQDLRHIRAIGRFYTDFDEIGLGIRDNLVNYAAGEAIKYSVTPKAELSKDETAMAVAKSLQIWLDEALEQNQWPGLREKQIMREGWTDGEALAILGADEDLEYPEIRISDCGHLVDPENLAQSQTNRLGLDYLDWSFGVGTPIGRADKPRGYFFDWYAQGDYQLLPASRVVHYKVNSHEDVKRGIAEAYVAHLNLKRAAKGTSATAQQAAIQATIAYIEKMADNTPAAAVQAATQTPGSISRLMVDALGQARVGQVQSFMGGKIITTAGTDFMYGPMGTPAGERLLLVFQAVLRRVAVRWQLPEWMVSGDASNNNMASSVVAETPFHRGVRTRQGEWAAKFEEICWKLIAMGFAIGRGPQGVPTDIRDLKKIVKLRAEMPDPKERDALEEQTILEIQHRNRVISAKTWADKVGLDYDTEEANLADEQKAELEKAEAMAKIAAENAPEPADGQDPTIANRQAVIKKRAAKKKASATESANALVEVLQGESPETRRDVAARILYDGDA